MKLLDSDSYEERKRKLRLLYPGARIASRSRGSVPPLGGRMANGKGAMFQGKPRDDSATGELTASARTSAGRRENAAPGPGGPGGDAERAALK